MINDQTARYVGRTVSRQAAARVTDLRRVGRGDETGDEESTHHGEEGRAQGGDVEAAPFVFAQRGRGRRAEEVAQVGQSGDKEGDCSQ